MSSGKPEDLAESERWEAERHACEYANYGLMVDGEVHMVCRCLVCGRCGKHTGNNTQGHLWGYCQVTRTVREPHHCCPDDCELEGATP